MEVSGLEQMDKPQGGQYSPTLCGADAVSQRQGQ